MIAASTLGHNTAKLSSGRFGVTALPTRAPRVLYLLLKEH
jgi:hypothetical protein